MTTETERPTPAQVAKEEARRLAGLLGFGSFVREDHAWRGMVTPPDPTEARSRLHKLVALFGRDVLPEKARESILRWMHGHT